LYYVGVCEQSHKPSTLQELLCALQRGASELFPVVVSCRCERVLHAVCHATKVYTGVVCMLCVLRTHVPVLRGPFMLVLCATALEREEREGSLDCVRKSVID